MLILYTLLCLLFVGSIVLVGIGLLIDWVFDRQETEDAIDDLTDDL